MKRFRRLVISYGSSQVLVIRGDSKLTRVRRARKYIERAIDVPQGAVFEGLISV